MYGLIGKMLTHHAHGEGSSPVLHGDKLIVNWDHEGESFLHVFDKLGVGDRTSAVTTALERKLIRL